MQHACCKHISGLYNLPFSMTINDLFQKPIISFYTFHMPIKFYSKLIVNGILTHSTLEYWHLKHRNMIAIEQKITHFSRLHEQNMIQDRWQSNEFLSKWNSFHWGFEIFLWGKKPFFFKKTSTDEASNFHSRSVDDFMLLSRFPMQIKPVYRIIVQFQFTILRIPGENTIWFA